MAVGQRGEATKFARRVKSGSFFGVAAGYGNSVIGFSSVDETCDSPLQVSQRRTPSPRGMLMHVDNARRRVLVAAGAGQDEPLHHLFTHGPFSTWEAIEADSFDRARFVLQ